jgi:hypothetical protein
MGTETALTEWSQPQVKAILFDQNHSILFFDGTTTFRIDGKALGLESLCTSSQELNFGDFSWMSLSPGYIEATVTFTSTCEGSRISKTGRVQFKVNFANQLDWNEFFQQSSGFVLSLKSVKWQIYFY